MMVVPTTTAADIPIDLEEDLAVEKQRTEHGGHDQRSGRDHLGGGEAVGHGGALSPVRRYSHGRERRKTS